MIESALFCMIDTFYSNILAEKDKEWGKMGRKVKGTLGFLQSKECMRETQADRHV